MAERLRVWDRNYRRWQGFVLGELVRLVRRNAPALLSPGGVVVDCGTGTGLALRALRPHLAGARIIGFDIQESALRIAQASGLDGEVLLLQADAHRWPLASACADLIIAKSASGYWRTPARVVSEVLRCLKPLGAFLLLEPNPASPIRQWYRRWKIERLLFPGLAAPGLEDFKDTDGYLSAQTLRSLFVEAGASSVSSGFCLGGLYHVVWAGKGAA